MAGVAESTVEAAALEWLSDIGWTTRRGPDAAPDGPRPERASHADTLLAHRLTAAINRLNPHITAAARADALTRVLASDTPSLIEENRRLHRLLVDGVPVEYRTDDGAVRGDRVRLIDYGALDRPGALDGNDWLAINQFTVIEGGHTRRADVVLFVNGLPLAVLELKNPGSAQATLASAHAQLRTYTDQIPSLFRTNALLVISDGLQAQMGSLTASPEWFKPWPTVDGEAFAPRGQPQLDTLIRGVFDHGRLLSLLRDFTVFTDGGAVKKVAAYQQFYAAHHALAATLRALPSAGAGSGLAERPDAFGLPSAADHRPGDRRIGVVWHTQGSGKSLLMAFYAGLLVREPALANPTIVVLTDRNDLDDQLFDTFAGARDLIRQTPLQADSRQHLRELLDTAGGGVIFTTIQKFSDGDGPVSERENVVVIADEAHRSQYGFRARLDAKTGARSYGHAKHLRDALPFASFIGFTGTPIEADDVNTPAVFGHYLDIYDISRAVEDGATVPIYYESRLARIELPDEAHALLDVEVDELTEAEEASAGERLKARWAAVEKLVGARSRVEMVAADLVEHWEARAAAQPGKGMIVGMSRRICVALYDTIVALRPDWHSDDDAAGAVKVVMTGSASDPAGWQAHVGGKARRDLLARRAKDPDDPLQLVIVRDMWLTGFDAPSLHTMYVDKPMRGHGLMQAIARVNRVFRDKQAGLIVDYIGVAQNLKDALGQYSPGDRGQVGIDEVQAVAVLAERHEVVRAMFHGFDLTPGVGGSPGQVMACLAGALDWVLARQQEAAGRETDDAARKAAHRRFPDAVLALSKAFALAAASDRARAVRDEVAFFQAVRAAMVKPAGRTAATGNRDFAVQQLIDRSVVSTEIVDILAAAGMATPELSILSDEFLAEMKSADRPNLALEALRKLLAGQVRSRAQTHVVEARRYSERLDAAIARYHINAVSTVEVIQTLIDLARDIREAQARGEEEGLTADEVAFYDALAENESAVEVLGNDNLKVIAAELVRSLRANASTDWAHRESARARMRVLVKRILRRFGYPPDLQDAAVQTVLQQAELLSMSRSDQS